MSSVYKYKKYKFCVFRVMESILKFLKRKSSLKQQRSQKTWFVIFIKAIHLDAR